MFHYQTIKFTSKSYQQYDVDAFELQMQLKILNLMKNKISKLEKGLFDSLTSLEELWLQNNEIVFIENKMFEQNKKLVTLYLNENKIVAVGPDFFNQKDNWKELTLYGNPCMNPNLKTHLGDQSTEEGFFYSGMSGYKKWSHDNKCVQSYDIYTIVRKDFEEYIDSLQKKAIRDNKKIAENQDIINGLENQMAHNNESFRDDLQEKDERIKELNTNISNSIDLNHKIELKLSNLNKMFEGCTNESQRNGKELKICDGEKRNLTITLEHKLEGKNKR
jgi:Leucine-rich repeat (LRR) protein